MRRIWRSLQIWWYELFDEGFCYRHGLAKRYGDAGGVYSGRWCCAVCDKDKARQAKRDADQMLSIRQRRMKNIPL